MVCEGYLLLTEVFAVLQVKWSVYMHYLSAAGLLLSLATVGFQLLSQALNIAASMSLSAWTTDNSTSVNGTQVIEKRNFYLEMYSGFGLGQSKIQ